MYRKLLTICFLAVNLLAVAQTRDLANMASGKLVFSSIVYDSNDNLYGYLYLYEKNVTERNKTMEYILLDKNLNEVSNADFNIDVYKEVFSKYYDCTLMNDYIILNKYYYYINGFTGTSKPLLTTFQIINLKNNAISNDYIYEDGELSNFTADFDKMKKEFKKRESKFLVSCFSNNENNGFIITEDQKKDSYLEKDIRFLGEDKKLQWSYMYNENGTENDYHTFRFLTAKNNNIYIVLRHWKKEGFNPIKIRDVHIVALDLKTGAEKYRYELENKDSEFTHTIYAREFDNKLYLVGHYMDNKTILVTDYKGFYRTVLSAVGDEIDKKYIPWTDYSGQLEIDKYGKVGFNNLLSAVRFFVLKDGSVSLLTEKYKTGGYNSVTVTDFILFKTDANFQPTGVTVIPKNRSYWSSDFEFYQYIKDDAGVVFFYTDDIKKAKANEAKRVLGIVTIIGDDISEEKVPLFTKKQYYIVPMPAKEGYVILREYNEVDKYNKIRLEKLNY